MTLRAGILIGLAAALLFAPTAASAAAAEVPVAVIGAPVADDPDPASLLKPTTFRGTFRVPHVDTALYVATPWAVRDLTVSLVGPGARRQTLVASANLPGHVLGVRLPGDAWTADRVELQAATVSAASPPLLLAADQLAYISADTWWYAVLFGLFGALVLVFAAVAVVRRTADAAWFALAMAGDATLLIPRLGIVRPPPEVSQPLHAVAQSLLLVALTAFAFVFLARRLPRLVVAGVWLVVAVAIAGVVAQDVMQDAWSVPDLPTSIIDGLPYLLFVALGVVAVVAHRRGAWLFLAGNTLAALGLLLTYAPANVEIVQSPLQIGAALRGLLIAFALVVRLRDAGPSTADAATRSADAAQADSAGLGEPLTVNQRVAPVLAAPPARDTAAGLQQRTDVDGLTGLANRSAADDALVRCCERARSEGAPLAALLVDVDLLKRYNDEYGHLAGDDVLRRVAGVIARAAGRDGDVAARYGGEEFLVLLGRTDYAEAQAAGQAIVDAVLALGIAHAGAPSKRLTVSVGAVSVVPDATATAGDLLRGAGNALYLAKTLGRNRVIAEPPLPTTP
ncbi:MAG: GGDEF domain-containing protein [Candidatus Eremiobacteraeota bacterium]|nr:GGDEF domain-containing protein [Candidatus Eremiobacteraeota bacterium]